MRLDPITAWEAYSLPGSEAGRKRQALYFKTVSLSGKLTVVSKKEFYALAIQRHGHDLGAIIFEEAEKIVNNATFRATVRDRTLARV